jgi:hypothetical protein
VTWLERLLGALSDARVEFIVVGGIAARAHGSPRLTQDVDVSYARSSGNLERIVSALAPFEPYLRGAPRGLPFEWSTETLERGLNFTLTTSTGDIDLLGEIIGGGTYEDLLPHTITIGVFDREIRFLDLPWLIRVKRAAGRPKDLETIAELEALQEEIEGES